MDEGASDRAGLSIVPTLRDLLDEPTKGLDMPPREAAALLLALAPVQRALELAAVAARLVTVSASENGERPRDRDFTEVEAAERLRKSVRWLRDNWRRKGVPGRKRGRTTVFPEAELERWMKRR